MTVMTSQPVIISGGGLIGLCLAQALKHARIPHKIYERDTGLFSRYGGWAISLQWAWPAMTKVLPPELVEKIEALMVDPSVWAKDLIPYQYIDLETGTSAHHIMAPPHLRVSRLKLREYLTEGLDINWGVAVAGWTPTTAGVSVALSNGTEVEGWFLACAEGKNSKLKHGLFGDVESQLHDFPLNFIGMRVVLSEEQIMPLRNIGPLIWEGRHHKTRQYLFFSTISTPEVNGSIHTEKPYYEAQLNLSSLADASSNSNKANIRADELVRTFKEAATEGTGFFKELKDILLSLPDDTGALDIKVQDWISKPWPSHGGRIVLLGDAAHAMTMFRGEAVNHGILDALRLVLQLCSVKRGDKSFEMAIEEYKSEVVERGEKAVMLSRQACLDAHKPQGPPEDSPLFWRSDWIEEGFVETLSNSIVSI